MPLQDTNGPKEATVLTGVPEYRAPPNDTQLGARPDLQKVKLEAEIDSIQSQKTLWHWWKQSKPTEWLTALAVAVGVVAAWRSGVFDAKSERLVTQKLLLESLQEKVKAKQEELSTLALEDTSFRDLGDLRKRGIFVRLSHDLSRGRTITLSDAVAWAGLPIPGEPEEGAPVAQALNAVQNLRNVQAIHIVSLRLDAEAIEAVTLLGELQSIAFLNCGVRAEILRASKRPLDTGKLNLSLNDLSSFEGCTLSPKVHWLVVRGNPLSSSGLDSLANTFPNVDWLDLADTNVGDDSIEEIARLKRLDTVVVQRTKITQAGLRKLAASSSLRNVRADDELVTDKFREEWRVLNPKASLLRHNEPLTPPDPIFLQSKD